jgi:hypothetical protein
MDQLIDPLRPVLVELYIECKSPVFLPIPAGRLASRPLLDLHDPSWRFSLWETNYISFDRLRADIW